MAVTESVTTKASNPDQVDGYMKSLNHPLRNVLEALRAAILSADKAVGEEIKWNAPTFFYMGPMKPFNPKEYKRYIIVSNVHRKDCIRLVFPSGARIGDDSGLLQGDYADGRRLASFSSLEDVERKRPALQGAIRKWLSGVDAAPNGRRLKAGVDPEEIPSSSMPGLRRDAQGEGSR